MIKPICRIFAVSCLFSLMLSCEKSTKDINNTNYPLVVMAKSLESQGAVRLFTKDGEVTDAASIARFTKNATIGKVAAFDAAFELDENNKITFLSKDSLMFANEPLTYGYKASNDGGFLISRYFQSSEQNLPPYGLSATEDLRRLGAHSSPLHKTTMPGGEVIFRGQETHIIYGSLKSFKLPLLIFKLKREESNDGEVKRMRGNIGKMFDDFNEDFIHTLKNQDTLAIQHHYIRYGQ